MRYLVFLIVFEVILGGVYGHTSEPKINYCSVNDVWLNRDSSAFLEMQETRELGIYTPHSKTVNHSNLYKANISFPFGSEFVSLEAPAWLNGLDKQRKIYEISEFTDNDVKTGENISGAQNVFGSSLSLSRTLKAGAYSLEYSDKQANNLYLENSFLYQDTLDDNNFLAGRALVSLNLATGDLEIVDLLDWNTEQVSLSPEAQPQWYLSSDEYLRARRISKFSDTVNIDFIQEFQIRSNHSPNEKPLSLKTLSEQEVRQDTGKLNIEELIADAAKNERWQTLFSFDRRYDRFDPYFFPLENGEANTFWAISTRGRDRAALVSVDGASGAEQVVYEHDNYEIKEVVFSSSNKTPLFATVGGLIPTYVAFDERFERIFGALKANAPYGISYKGMDERGVLFQYDDNVRGVGYIYAEFESQEIRYLGFDCEQGNRISNRSNSETTLFFHEQKNGVHHGAYLTLPEQVNDDESTPLTLIVADPLDRTLSWADRPDKVGHRFPVDGNNVSGDEQYKFNIPINHPEQNAGSFWQSSDRSYWLEKGHAVLEVLPWGVPDGPLATSRYGKRQPLPADYSNLVAAIDELIQSHRIDEKYIVVLTSGAGAKPTLDIVSKLQSPARALILDSPVLEVPELQLSAGRGYTEAILKAYGQFSYDEYFEQVLELPDTFILGWRNKYISEFQPESYPQCDIQDDLKGISRSLKTAEYEAVLLGDEFWQPLNFNQLGAGTPLSGRPFVDIADISAMDYERRRYLVSRFLADISGKPEDSVPTPRKYFGYAKYDEPCD